MTKDELQNQRMHYNAEFATAWPLRAYRPAGDGSYFAVNREFEGLFLIRPRRNESRQIRGCGQFQARTLPAFARQVRRYLRGEL